MATKKGTTLTWEEIFGDVCPPASPSLEFHMLVIAVDESGEKIPFFIDGHPTGDRRRKQGFTFFQKKYRFYRPTQEEIFEWLYPGLQKAEI